MEGLKMGDSDNYLMQKQMEMMIETSNKKITAELKELREGLIQLNDEVQELKRQLKNARAEAAETAPRPQYSQPAPQQSYSPPPQADPSIKRQPTRDQEMAQTSNRPKFTEFTEEEVSINSVFYAGRGGMGKKK